MTNLLLISVHAGDPGSSAKSGAHVVLPSGGHMTLLAARVAELSGLLHRAADLGEVVDGRIRQRKWSGAEAAVLVVMTLALRIGMSSAWVR